MKTDLFINNEWRPAASGKRFPVENPATEENLADVAEHPAWADHGRAWRDRIRLSATVPAVAAGVDLAGVPQVPPVEIGPERVEKHQFGVGGLPEQEVRKALLA